MMAMTTCSLHWKATRHLNFSQQLLALQHRGQQMPPLLPAALVMAMVVESLGGCKVCI